MTKNGLITNLVYLNVALNLKVLLISFSCNLVDSQTEAVTDVVEGILVINGKSSIAKIDSDFICATTDWWPLEKCNYGICNHQVLHNY